MEFTYNAYENLIELLRKNDYEFANYQNYESYIKPVIMRHDVDNSLSKAVELAYIEQSEGISSTYFILLSTDMYNVASAESLKKIRAISECGHEIGLHFDEVKYNDNDDIKAAILNEKRIMEMITGLKIETVSMHRPSKEILDADMQIPGMINSYGKEFFGGFKYVSDSHRRWREDVMAIIESRQYDKLHILTHPIWYHETEENIKTTMNNFIESAMIERYESVKDNITDIDEILE